MKTVYLAMIDEAAMLERLPLERTGTWEGDLPGGEVAEGVRTDRFCNCVQLQARGSLACYNVLDGLQSPEKFGDGVWLPGAQYLPIAAFHGRMYGATLDRVAEVLDGYDQIIAHVFERGVVRGTRGLIGSFSVEFYEGDPEWCGNGHVGGEMIVWRLRREAAVPEEPAEAVCVPRKRNGRNDQQGSQ